MKCIRLEIYFQSPFSETLRIALKTDLKIAFLENLRLSLYLFFEIAFWISILSGHYLMKFYEIIVI